MPKIGFPEPKVSQRVSIPDPRADVNSLMASVTALKQMVETLAGTRGQLGVNNSDTDRPLAAITRGELRDAATYEELRSKITRDIVATSSAAAVNKAPGAAGGLASTTPGLAFIATDLNVVPNSGIDQAANIQLAIDELNQVGGGTLLFPAGEYPLYSQIVVPTNVTLAGVGPGTSLYSNFVASFTGTVFSVYWGQFDPTTTDAQRAAIILNSGAGFRDCAITYPLQNEASSAVVEYAPAIKLYENTSRTVHGNCLIQNVVIHKAYTGIDMRGSSSRPSVVAQMQGIGITDVVLMALEYGIRIDNAWTGCVFTRCTQRSPWLSRTYTTPGSSLRDYAQKNCTFLDIGGVAEQLTFTDCGAWQVNHAATFFGVSGPVSFTNCTFEACRKDVFVASNNGPRLMARCVNSVFSAYDAIEEAVSGSARVAGYVLSIESGTTLAGFQFSNCLLQKGSKGWLNFTQASQSVSNVILNGCMTNLTAPFGGAGAAVTVTSGVSQCIITSNVFTGLTGTLSGTLGSSIVVNNI